MASWMATLHPWAALLFCSAALLFSAVAGAQSFPPKADLPDAETLKPNPDLPDPLTFLDGRRVTNRQQWENERRPELKRLFQHYMYGYIPSAPGNLRADVEVDDPLFFGGKATLRYVTLHFGPSGTPPLHFLLVVPNHRRRPAPAFLGLAFCAPFAAVNDPRLPVPEGWMYPFGADAGHNRAVEADRGSQASTWNIEQSIDRGYAVALFYNGDIAPDVPDFSQGVFPHILRSGQKQHDPSDWGTIAAWAWGLERAMDYLVKTPEIDGKKIAVVGHSRCGKAALLAGAFDERIALVIPLQAGCGGTAPSRGKVGESVKQINTAFPHWFDAEFKKFSEHPENLPFDQHELIALVAPRPVLLSNASEDTWANPEGQFEMLKAADPVYRLLGVEGLKSRDMPKEGHLLDSRLGYFIRPGKHSMTGQDWHAFLDFADRHFGKPD